MSLVPASVRAAKVQNAGAEYASETENVLQFARALGAIGVGGNSD